MKIDQAQLDKVEVKLNKQNGLSAVLGAAFWTMPFIVIWFLIYLYNPNLSPLMLLLNGFLVGLVVRIHGKGLTGVFSIIAMTVHTCIVIVAFSLNIIFAGTIWALLLFALYAAGVLAAKKVSRIEVPFEEHRAYSYLTSPEPHKSNNKLKNRWFIILPILLVTVALSSFVSVVSLELFTGNQNNADTDQQRELIQNKEINILPEFLKKRSSQDILRYSYAYHSGLLFSKGARSSEVFPRSEYKALTLLKYLVENRDNARAKFILGFLTGGIKGDVLIQAAVDQNDKYARIYSIVGLGCYSNESVAIELLGKLLDSSHEDYIQEEINGILYVGIKETCNDFEQPKFSLSYVVNYSEKN
jgi:hypothetical protein